MHDHGTTRKLMCLCDVIFCLPNQSSFNAIRWFLQEKRLRERLTDLYLAINVYRVHNRSNAEIFSNLELSSLESDVTFFGNFLQKGAAEDTLDWLRNLRHFSISDDIFLQQILEPVREIARYRIRVGKLGTTRSQETNSRRPGKNPILLRIFGEI